MATEKNTLSLFHPLIERWFRKQVGTPTAIQALAWPIIAGGEHVLLTAPTGSGKTLTAFLWALNQLVTGRWPAGATRVLYVSPLKALNTDIRRNLLGPLAGLAGVFQEAGEPFPELSVMTRSGDTEAAERRRMLRRPPELLITTPESLNILLTSKSGTGMFGNLATVIVDEIHAVAGSKRGTHLATAVERLTRLSGEFQRIAISATVKPMEAVAAFVGGYRLETSGSAEPRYEPRPVRVVSAPSQKQIDVEVRFFPRDNAGDESPGANPGASPYIPQLAEACKDIIRRNRSTLLFTNNRRHCETIAMLLNQDEPEMLAYSHHGSLSREIRAVVEQRLKAGELKAIVATSSLELGIDIGALDQVVLVGTPMTVASAVQRIGRAGHQVGAVSHGLLLPLHGRDLMDAAVMAPAIAEQDIETIAPVPAPLDVLAQVIVSMTGVETWDVDTLYAFVRTMSPYRHLERRHFDLVVDMLAGRYEDSRLRFLQPLVSFDRVDNTLAAKEHAVRLLYSSGGTIPDRGYFNLRRKDTQGKIGELDEEFVWERNLGDTFALGMQSWKIVQITHNDVFVEPSRPRAADVPFWRAEDLDRSYHFSARIGEFLEHADALLRVDPEALRRELRRRHFLDEAASATLLEFLQRQRAATQAALPHHRHVLVESYMDMQEAQETTCVIIHAIWGGRVNRPLSFALAQAWEDAHGERIETFSTNEAIILLVPGRRTPGDIMGLVEPAALEGLLRRRLESTGFFGARFRENAARALLLPRQSFGRRMPLWLNRQRSKRLLDAVGKYEDFPILVETWRACIQDEFDLPVLRALLADVASGAVRVTETATAGASPFASGALWRLTNVFMYEGDEPVTAGPSRLSEDLVKEAVFSAELRPQLPRELCELFEQKAQRLFPGYAPRTPQELLEWVKERQFLPLDEWERLLSAAERDAAAPARTLLKPLAGKLLQGRFSRPGREPVVAVLAVENAARIMAAFQVAPEQCFWNAPAGGAVPPVNAEALDSDAAAALLAEWLGEWLRFYGPREPDYVQAALPVDAQRLAEALETLLDERAVVVDHLIAPGSALQVCDAENLEILLRLNRTRQRPDVRPLPIDALPLFVARHQGLAGGKRPLQETIEPLIGYAIPSGLFETDVLPARVDGYAPAALDELVAESGLGWFGVEEKKLALGFEESRDLFMPARAADGTLHEQIGSLFADARGQYHFDALLDSAKLSSTALAGLLWELVWKGAVANDSFAALRKGIQTSYKVREPMLREGGRLRRAHFQAWKTGRAYPGTWRLLPAVAPPADAIDEEEINKERVRLLLARYGVLFRELLARELPMLRWGVLFRALRLMEMSGEIVAGSFFDEVPGLQFISPANLRAFREPLPEDAIYWMNAVDPASLCGIELPALKPALQKRVATTHLVYHGRRLVVVSRRNGKELEIHVPPDHPRLREYLALFEVALTRAFQPVHRIAVETINGERAIHSPYTTWLRDWFEVLADPKSIWLCRRRH